MSDTFCIDNDMMCLAASSVVNDVVDQLLLIVIIALRKKNIFRAVRDAAPQSDVAGITAHDLDNGASLMGRGCIADFIDCFHGCVDSRIESDRVLCAGNIQIDRTRDADNVDSLVRKFLCAAIGTVTSDYDKSFDTVLVADFDCSRNTFRCAHLFAASRSEDSTALLDRVGDIAGLHFLDVFLHKACIASLNTIDVHASCKAMTHNCANRRVHSRRVATACENTDCFNLFFSHCIVPLGSVFALLTMNPAHYSIFLCMFTLLF